MIFIYHLPFSGFRNLFELPATCYMLPATRNYLELPVTTRNYLKLPVTTCNYLNYLELPETT